MGAITTTTSSSSIRSTARRCWLIRARKRLRLHTTEIDSFQFDLAIPIARDHNEHHAERRVHHERVWADDTVCSSFSRWWTPSKGRSGQQLRSGVQSNHQSARGCRNRSSDQLLLQIRSISASIVADVDSKQLDFWRSSRQGGRVRSSAKDIQCHRFAGWNQPSYQRLHKSGIDADQSISSSGIQVFDGIHWSIFD